MTTPRLRIISTIEKAREEDRKELEDFLKSRAIYPSSPNADFITSFKRAHKAVYSLCFWSNEFVNAPAHQQIFLQELRSDALQSIPLAMSGFKKPVALLLRSTIEDVLRHIYYYDHVVEFQRLEQSPTNHQKVRDLWQYAKDHPKLGDIFENSKSAGYLKNEYSILSGFVHSTGTNNMSLTKCMSEVNFENEYFKDFTDKICKLSASFNFILLEFYQQNLTHFNPQWKNYILYLIPQSLRKKQ